MSIEVVHVTGYGYKVKLRIEEYNYDTNAWEAADLSSFPIGDIDFLFQQNDGTIIETSPQFTTDGSDGYLEYTVLSGDNIFTEGGMYEVQVRFQSGGQRFFSTVYKFLVENPLSTT